MRIKILNINKLVKFLLLKILSGAGVIRQWILFSIFDGNLKTARSMRKPANRLGKDFLQRMPVIGLG